MGWYKELERQLEELNQFGKFNSARNVPAILISLLYGLCLAFLTMFIPGQLIALAWYIVLGSIEIYTATMLFVTAFFIIYTVKYWFAYLDKFVKWRQERIRERQKVAEKVAMTFADILALAIKEAGNDGRKPTRKRSTNRPSRK